LVSFFGILPKRLENVKEAPWTMLLPMGILSVLSLIFGIMPGLPLKVISEAMDLMNIQRPNFTLFGIQTPLGVWQTGVIVILMIMAFVLGIVLLLLGNRKVRYTTTYTCGVSDLDGDNIQVASQNLYESAGSIIKKVYKKTIVPVFGSGEEAMK
jgi:NADH:ubiquinone oxidoreductase subunit 5 (subunit L)/multisubunit Na+/H+ antiporter MnhA subunit